MALDTQEKRMAAVGVGRPWMRAKLPVATPDAEWRASSGNGYGSYLPSQAVVALLPAARDILGKTNRVRYLGRE